MHAYYKLLALHLTDKEICMNTKYPGLIEGPFIGYC